VTAISFHAYPYVQHNYALMPSGGSVGDGYGPMIVASKPLSLDDVKKVKIAIPGTLTTATLALRLFAPNVETEVVEFDKIIPAVLEGKYDAGLIIHEGQLTYDKSGLHRILDLGKWWRDLTGLPLPLGANAIRKTLGPETIAKVARRCATASSTPLTTARKRLSTPCSLPAIWIRATQTSSWACT